MQFRGLPKHQGLQEATRIPISVRGQQALPALEFVALLLIGGLATCLMVFWDWGVKQIPGHAILRSVFPMVCGLALVPRKGAGTTMGIGALATLIGLNLLMRDTPGWGASTSLLLIGPMMDLALWSARPGRWMYVRFALAGFAANLVAFLIKAGTKYFDVVGSGGKPLALWLPKATLTYTVCGLLAGVISAAVWFHSSRPNSPDGLGNEASQT
ncbi:MAG: hypothetical protein KDA84_12010 [Planctomycetaceae bacterium]|nr:hypothetical protein [Planctomycetaceae bacterium]